MRYLAPLLTLLFATQAAAQEVPLHRVRGIPASQLLTAKALNGAAATLTFTITNPGYARANLAMNRTRSSGTDLTMTCTRTNSAGVASTVQVCEYAAATGTCTHYTNTWKSATSSTEVDGWQIDILGYPSVTCIVASTAAGAGDLLTITGDLVTQ